MSNQSLGEGVKKKEKRENNDLNKSKEKIFQSFYRLSTVIFIQLRNIAFDTR